MKWTITCQYSALLRKNWNEGEYALNKFYGKDNRLKVNATFTKFT